MDLTTNLQMYPKINAAVNYNLKKLYFSEKQLNSLNNHQIKLKIKNAFYFICFICKLNQFKHFIYFFGRA